MDRRHFLSTSIMAVAASAVAGPHADASRESAFRETRFRGLLGSRFEFTGDDWRGPLHLSEVLTRTSDARLEQFTAVFRTDAAVRPAPGIYAVNHPDLGDFSLRIDGRPDSELRLAAFAILRG
jgi:hypothetical protein